MGELYSEIKNLYKAVEEKGYISREETGRVEYLAGAVERKLEDIEEGKYSLTEEAALAANITKQIGAKLRDTYKGGSGRMYQ